MFIRIGDDYFNTELIACVRPTPDDDQTVIFTAGQSAVDQGFLVDLPVEEVLQSIQQARLLELTSMMEAEDETEPDPDLLADNSAIVDGTR